MIRKAAWDPEKLASNPAGGWLQPSRASAAGAGTFRTLLPMPHGHQLMKDRGPPGVQLVISDACIGLLEAAAELFPEMQWQRCVAHFYRDVFTHHAD